MNFKKIDMETWKRKEYYNFYKDVNPCTYSATVNIDITSFKKLLKIKDRKFYASFIYLITKTVNNFDEFRTNVNSNGILGIYDYLNPSYTIFHKESETFSSLYTMYDNDYEKFYKSFETDIKEYGNIEGMFPKGNIENCINISALNNLDFTSFSLNIKNNFDYLLPIFTIGKFKEVNEDLLLPLSIQVHHSVIDGFHLSRFYKQLQNNVNNFTI